MPDIQTKSKFSWPNVNVVVRFIRMGLGVFAMVASMYIMAEWMGGDWVAALAAIAIELTIIQFLIGD